MGGGEKNGRRCTVLKCVEAERVLLVSYLGGKMSTQWILSLSLVDSGGPMVHRISVHFHYAPLITFKRCTTEAHSEQILKRNCGVFCSTVMMCPVEELTTVP